MKKIIKIVFSLGLLLIVVAVSLPFIISKETYKKEIVARVKEMTGRELTITGDINATIFPALGVKMQKVTFANAPGFTQQNMIIVEGLTAEVALLPLLSGQVQVKSFILDKPIINLEVSTSGKPNWDFAPTKKEAAKSAGLLFREAQASEYSVQNIELGDVQIKDGAVSYVNHKEKANYKASNVNLKAGLKSLTDKLELDGSALYNKENVKLKLTLDSPADVMNGKEAALKLKMDAAPAQFIFDGKAREAGINGRVEFGTFSLPSLAKWTGSNFDWKGKTKLAFGARGGLNCSSNQCDFKEADIVLDDLKFNGNMSVAFGGAVPNIKANLKTDALNLNPYMETASAFDFGLIASAQAAAWSTERIDLSGLRAANADLTITANSVNAGKFNIGATTLQADLNGGALKLQFPNTALYGGKGNATINVSAGGSLSADINVSGIQAEPFLKDASDFDRLTGTGNGNVKLNMHGGSMAEWMNTLSGNGDVKFTDGAIRGINIAQMIRNAKNILTGAISPEQKTDFSELSGTFTIANGLLTNKDAKMKAPLLRVGGAGTVDFPRQYVNYKVTPEIVQTTQGQGGKDKEGLQVPVIIEGTFDRLSYRPDMEGMVKDALQNPEKLKETVKDIKGQIKDLKKDKGGLGDLLGGFKKEKAPAPVPAPAPAPTPVPTTAPAAAPAPAP